MAIAKHLTKTEIEMVYSAANSAIWYSHHLVSQLVRSVAREEDYVATLVTNGVALLAERWNPILAKKGIEIAISGVFCHGHPQVVFGRPRSRVELADLLVVHQHSTRMRCTARAILVQAKMSVDATHTLPFGDPQLLLYSTWPQFEFVSGGLAAGPRNILDHGRGSRYALILSEHSFPEEISWADQCPWATCYATRQLSADRSFSKLLGDLMLSKDGRPVDLWAPKDDWSRTIKELLEVTGKRTYRRKNIGWGKTARLSPLNQTDGVLFLAGSHPVSTGQVRKSSKKTLGDQFFAFSLAARSEGNDDVPPNNEVARVESAGGMSVLLIETRDLED